VFSALFNEVKFGREDLVRFIEGLRNEELATAYEEEVLRAIF
jgi:hypothetical protein